MGSRPAPDTTQAPTQVTSEPAPPPSLADTPPPPGTTHWAPPPTPPSSPQLTHSRLSKPPAQHPTPPKLLHRQPRSLLPLPPSQTRPNHQVPLIGHLHPHHPPAPSSLILGSLSLPPSTRHHPSSYTGNLRACSPSLPRRPSQTTRHHSLATY